MTTLPIGQFRFSVGREIGRGGFGVVDVIRVVESNTPDAPVGTEFARKRLNAKFGRNNDATTRFEREIAAVAAMTHPGIVPLRGQNLRGEERFYMMPLYPGSLRDHLSMVQAPMDTKAAAGFVAGIADALQHAHRKGYLHRDLKPENVMLTHTGAPVVVDWGLGYFLHKESKLLDFTQTQGGIGTFRYCSYEQFLTGKCRESGDIYSLGVLFAELLAGRLPPLGPGDGLPNGIYARPRSQQEQQANAVIAQMTAFRPENRVSSMANVVSLLATI